MPRKKSEVKSETTDGAQAPAKREPFAETELASLATLGPAFAAGVDKLRAQIGTAAEAKIAAKVAAKLPKLTLKKLRAAAENVLAAGE
jgi:hypothetical protein